jgi:hypothetical protein
VSEQNIYQRINAVMARVAYVKKDASVTGGGANYKAVTRDSVVGILREELVKAGIVVETSQLAGEWTVLRDVNAQPQPIKMGLYSGYYEVRFINIDNPEDRAVMNIEAHASDNGDKAPGKAATYAEKTALLKQFLLETGLNDEERPAEAGISQEQADQFGYLVEQGDAMALWLFMSQFPSDSIQRKELFDSIPYGQKSKIKEAFLSLSSEAVEIFGGWAVALSHGIETEDGQKVVEHWDELEQVQKQKVWALLSESDRNYLKARKANG